jgi:hypothetical protein
MSDSTALIKKSLAGLQDLTLGKGTEEQQRGSGVYTIDKVRLMLPIDSLDVLTTLNPEQFPEVLYVPLGLMYVHDGTTYVPKINIGTTAERPTSPVDGLQFKDTTLKKTVTWYTNNWYDETGSVV